MAEPREVVKEVKNAKLFNDGSILLVDVRASYPHVLTKYRGRESEKAKHSIVCLIPKKKSHREARELLEEVIADILKENKVRKMSAPNKFLRDGDESEKEENEGNWTVNASGDRVVARDNVRDKKTKKLRILVKGEDDDRIYGGCYVNALIRPWFQDNEHGRKINAGLIAVQFLRDGEPFGEGRISEEEVDEAFDRYAEDEEDDDDDDDEDEKPRRKSKAKKPAPKRRRARDDDDEDDDDEL